jgi:hypothetical protein
MNSIRPQVEVHVYFNQKSMIDLCREYEIVVTAYGPLGRPGLSQDPVNDPTLLDDPKIKEIALKYGRTVAQILLRYLVCKKHKTSFGFYGFPENLQNLLTLICFFDLKRQCRDCPSSPNQLTETEF